MHPYLIDSNVLVYILAGEPTKQAQVLRFFRAHPQTLVVSSQNIVETCAVLSNKYGVPLAKAQNAVMRLLEEFQIQTIFPHSDTLSQWMKLCHRKKRPVYDSFLVATMRSHQITHLYTENTRDFQGYAELTVTGLE